MLVEPKSELLLCHCGTVHVQTVPGVIYTACLCL